MFQDSLCLFLYLFCSGFCLFFGYVYSVCIVLGYGRDKSVDLSDNNQSQVTKQYLNFLLTLNIWSKEMIEWNQTVCYVCPDDLILL